jgi:hypothetical protein
MLADRDEFGTRLRGAEELAAGTDVSAGREAGGFEMMVELRLEGALSRRSPRPILLWRARLAIVSLGTISGMILFRTGFALNCGHILVVL